MGSRHNLTMARYKRATPYKPKTKKERGRRREEDGDERVYNVAPCYDDANRVLEQDDWGWYFKMREEGV